MRAVSPQEERVLGYFAGRREAIAAALHGFLARRSAELARVSPLGTEVCTRLEDFAARGKMIRGGLVCHAASLGGAEEEAPVRVGAAMELIQSALLIHDDIMDRDTHRRGHPAIHVQYARQATEQGAEDAAHFGVSMGVCAGDVAFFLAFDLLAEIDVEPALRSRLVALFARELSLVGVAQMMDMAASATPREQAVEDILRLYLYKTGRYTFSLPLAAGAALGGLEARKVAELERAGEQLGMLFQIKDDELGLYGESSDTGKPVGSDIREGKKTIHHACLMRRAPPQELDRIRSLWGSKDITDADVRSVLDAMERHGVRAEVQDMVRSLSDRAREIALAGGYPFLHDLIGYSLERRR